MTLSRSFIAGVCTSFFGLLALSEILLRLTVPTGFWYRHFDLSGDMTSLAELKDRLAYAAPQEHRILLLGDSVLGASALMEHRIPDARQKTLSHFLKGELEAKGENPLSLGSDGLLLPDMEGLSLQAVNEKPKKIILLLNFRMFSKDFVEGPKSISRNFLRLWLLPGAPPLKMTDLAPNQETLLSDVLYSGMCDHWFLFRETQMAKVLWYYPSQKDFFQRWLEKAVGKNEAQSDILEAALKQKIAPYYQAYSWDTHTVPFQSLKRILDWWGPMDVPIVVVLTPQNPKFLGSYLDKPSFEKNRKTLAAFLKPYQRSGLVYEDWANKYPPADFLDHCHLTPEGNERYAADLTALCEGGKR